MDSDSIFASGVRSANPEKVALLELIAPLFPIGHDFPSVSERIDDSAALARRERALYEEVMLPYWACLAPAYQEALSRPFGQDAATLTTVVEDWPTDFATQQERLHDLLQVSKLRSAWRDYCQWMDAGGTTNSAERRTTREALERAVSDADQPIQEIPLYQSYIRASCQQVVCLPATMWDCLHSNEPRYQPGLIDVRTVERLATRIAQVFNAPPVVPVHLLQDGPSWAEAIVWKNGQRQLTCPINSHGMRDRLADEYGHPSVDADSLLFPEWRFDGFYGRLRITLEDGTSWVVVVLAPKHFVRRLMLYPEWYARAKDE